MQESCCIVEYNAITIMIYNNNAFLLQIFVQRNYLFLQVFFHCNRSFIVITPSFMTILHLSTHLHLLPTTHHIKKKRSVIFFKKESQFFFSFFSFFSSMSSLFFLLFGSSPSPSDCTRWLSQSLCPSGITPYLPSQYQGGPCGVLAALQAEILRLGLFGTQEDRQKWLQMMEEKKEESGQREEKKNEGGKEEKEKVMGIEEEQEDRIGQVERMRDMSVGSEAGMMDNEKKREVNAETIEANLLRLSQDSLSFPLALMHRAISELLIRVQSNNRIRISIYNGAENFLHPFSADEFFGNLVIIERTPADLAAYICEISSVWASPLGAISLLCSIVLTRGIDKVKSDMDDPNASLIVEHGHCSQELLHLMITGQAISNAFDGVKNLGMLEMKGMTKRHEIGFLSVHEALRYAKVGQYLKCPRFPIWVIGGTNHYTVCWGLDTKISELSEVEEVLLIVKTVFHTLDQVRLFYF